jgi:hypothetical protein
MKKIHILLSRESFNDLKKIKKEVFVECKFIICEDEKSLPDTYEEYLKQEEIKPTMALFG